MRYQQAQPHRVKVLSNLNCYYLTSRLLPYNHGSQRGSKKIILLNLVMFLFHTIYFLVHQKIKMIHLFQLFLIEVIFLIQDYQMNIKLLLFYSYKLAIVKFKKYFLLIHQDFQNQNIPRNNIQIPLCYKLKYLFYLKIHIQFNPILRSARNYMFSKNYHLDLSYLYLNQ